MFTVFVLRGGVFVPFLGNLHCRIRHVSKDVQCMQFWPAVETPNILRSCPSGCNSCWQVHVTVQPMLASLNWLAVLAPVRVDALLYAT